MKATLTSKGQITIPAGIRARLGLTAGQVLEFDETAPYLKAVPAFEIEDMQSVVGIARARLKKTSKQWLDETRGLALPHK